MKTRLLTIIEGLGICLAFATGCGPKSQSDAPSFETSPVRLHRRFTQKDAPSLSLAAPRPEIIRLSRLGESSWASWIVYDSQLMDVMTSISPQAVLETWLASYGDLIGSSDPDEWRSLSSQNLSQFYTAYSYQRFVDGIEVRDSQLQIILSRDTLEQWRIVEITANATGPISEDAKSEALSDQEFYGHEECEALTIEQKKVEWIPFSLGSGFQHELATSFEVRDERGDQRVVTLLNKDARILENYGSSLHLKSIQARALKRSYRDSGPREYPLAFATALEGSKAESLGAEAFSKGAQSVSLQGPRVLVNDSAGAIPSLGALVDQGDSLLLSPEGYDFAAVNSFVAVQRVNRFVRQFIDPAEAGFLDEVVRLVVNSGDGSCNAFYSPKAQRILLYKEDSDCANMALLNDVIYHEWGHALDDHLGATPGIVDYAFSEGIADTLAAFFNDDPEIAPGFFFNDPSPVRSVENNRHFPEDVGSPHFEGGIISGSFWDLRKALIDVEGKKYGSYLAGQLFLRHLLTVDSYGGSYAAVLRLDDDDGRPETPSPHACLIQEAFSRHGLSAKPDAACSKVVQDKSHVDDLLQMSVWEDPDAPGEVHLLAASANAARMGFCWGQRAQCIAEPARRRELALVSTNQEARFYISEPLRITGRLNTLTLLVLDENGLVSGSRQFVLHDK